MCINFLECHKITKPRKHTQRTVSHFLFPIYVFIFYSKAFYILTKDLDTVVVATIE